jgi:hypothetical protein
LLSCSFLGFDQQFIRQLKSCLHDPYYHIYGLPT